ncbi:MAG: dTMP kinase [Alphaproteobacteria bacterium]|nr:dTMP kinase [Alphaproteobacteria bacterium]
MGQSPLSARGRFITLEGGEGAGKSTQAALLVAALERAGIAAVATREPGGSPGAEAIRALLLRGEVDRWDAVSETLLFSAARRDHVANVVAPRLAAGTWVVCDRYIDSTIAYQGYGRGLPIDELMAIQRFASGNLWPDLTLILDLTFLEGFRRAAGRAGAADRFERLDHEFHERLRSGFLRIARDDPGRCAVIDASGDVMAVQRAICAAVTQRLAIRLA